MKEPKTQAATKEQLFLDYIGYYEERWLRGQLSPCNEEATKERAKQLLKPAACSCQEFGGIKLYSIIETCLQMNEDRECDSLKNLITAFEFLELVCVNLFLSPWRKEIKSLKTFTGNFVYNVRSVLPENVVTEILEKIGYTAKTATEFRVTGKINAKETQTFAFQIFLARIECELILEMSNEDKTCAFLKLLQKRSEIPENGDDSKDREKQRALREEPGNLVNANKQKAITCSISQQGSVSKDDLSFGVRDSKGTDRSESSEDRRMDIKGMYRSESNTDKRLDSAGMYDAEPLADSSSSKGMDHSESAEDRRDSKKRNNSPSAETKNMSSKEITHFKSTADGKVDSKREYHSKSTEDGRMNSREPYNSESAQGRSHNKGTLHSDSASESQVLVSTSQRIDRIIEPKSQASECFHSKRSESEEFLTQYSDLNIAQKPIFQEQCPKTYTKRMKKKSGTGLSATVLEDLQTTEASPPKFHESGPQSFAICNEAKAENQRPTKKSKAIQETWDFTTNTILIPINPLHKHLIVESYEVKQEHDPTSCSAPVQPDLSNEVECELSSSFSKLNITETVEEHLTYPIEETTEHESETLKSSPTINSKDANNAQIEYLNPTCDYVGENNDAEGGHTLLMATSKTDECIEDATTESIKRPLIDTTTAERPSENFRHVREPPNSIYVPPQSLESQCFNDNYISMHFHFQPKEKDEHLPSTGTVPVGDSVFQMNEDIKEDFVIISHPVTPMD